MPEINFPKNLVRQPVYASEDVKGRQSPRTYMSNDLVPGSNLYVALSWIFQVPEPNPHISEHTLDYDAFILYLGMNPGEPEDLGAEIDYYVGGQRLNFNTTSAIYVPKGVRHGPAVWKKVKKPHLEMIIARGGGNTGTVWTRPRTGRHQKGLPEKTDKVNYEKYIVRKPQYQYDVQEKTSQGSLGPVSLYISNDLVPGSNMYIDYNWVLTKPETFIFEHLHHYDEVVLHIGNDPEHPEDLGAEIEFCVPGKPLIFNTTAALYLPKEIKHGPLNWKKVTRPHLQMPIIIGAGTRAQAAPAGYPGE